MRRNKQIYLPAPLSDYFAPAFCSRPYETQMSSEARASYRVLSITALCAPEDLMLDYWLQHKACRCCRRADESTAKQGCFFFYSFSKEELHLAADAQVIARERISRVDERQNVRVCVCKGGTEWLIKGGGGLRGGSMLDMGCGGK